MPDFDVLALLAVYTTVNGVLVLEAARRLYVARKVCEQTERLHIRQIETLREMCVEQAAMLDEFVALMNYGAVEEAVQLLREAGGSMKTEEAIR